MDLLQSDSQFLAGQVDTQAAVQTETEAQMGIGRTPEVQLVGIEGDEESSPRDYADPSL